jgi:hypothetical protein
MSTNLGQRAVPATELKETMTGSWVYLGSFSEAPIIAVFDSLSDDEIEISFDGGTTTWKTFEGHSALVLDLRANKGKAGGCYLAKNLPVFANGASGEFSISYLYSSGI